MKRSKTDTKYRNLPDIEGVGPNGKSYKRTDKHWYSRYLVRKAHKIKTAEIMVMEIEEDCIEGLKYIPSDRPLSYR